MPSSPPTPATADLAHHLLESLWQDYVASTPQALRIHRLLADRGENLRNDHVALRSFALGGLGVSTLARSFESAGWQPRDRYRFEDKHLLAQYWRHPDPALPKVFISELQVDKLSPAAQQLISGLVAQVPPGFTDRVDLPWAGRPWHLPHSTYQRLLAESEYAAWMAAFGFRVNHFTVDLGALHSFATLPELNQFLQDHGFALNAAGGLVKGSPVDLLEQSSTLADSIAVSFDDGVVALPSCYYEFARRYPGPDGELFHGFVPASANRLFESTDVGRRPG